MTPMACRVPWPPGKVALTGEDSSRTRVSSASSRLSSFSGTRTVLLVCPGAKVSVPGVSAAWSVPEVAVESMCRAKSTFTSLPLARPRATLKTTAASAAPSTAGDALTDSTGGSSSSARVMVAGAAPLPVTLIDSPSSSSRSSMGTRVKAPAALVRPAGMTIPKPFTGR